MPKKSKTWRAKPADTASCGAGYGPGMPVYNPPGLRNVGAGGRMTYIETRTTAEFNEQAEEDLADLQTSLFPECAYVTNKKLFDAIWRYHGGVVMPVTMQVQEQGVYHEKYMKEVEAYFATRDLEHSEVAPDLMELMTKLQLRCKIMENDLRELKATMSISHEIYLDMPAHQKNYHLHKNIAKKKQPPRRGPSPAPSAHSQNSHQSRAASMTDDQLSDAMNEPVLRKKYGAVETYPATPDDSGEDGAPMPTKTTS